MKPKKTNLLSQDEHALGTWKNRIGSPGRAGKLLNSVIPGDKDSISRKGNKQIPMAGTLERLLKSGRSNSPSKELDFISSSPVNPKEKIARLLLSQVT